MSLFIETIRFESGVAPLLPYHQVRMEKSIHEVLRGRSVPSLDSFLKLPNRFRSGVVKCRVLYDHTIQQVDWSHYQRRSIDSLCMIRSDFIRYDFKFENREEINALAASVKNPIEILIVKQGMVTDTSFTNVALSKDNGWYTPENPLLFGTRLLSLLDLGMITEAKIPVSEIYQYQKIRLFNAMIPWDEAIEIDTKNIY